MYTDGETEISQASEYGRERSCALLKLKSGAFVMFFVGKRLVTRVWRR